MFNNDMIKIIIEDSEWEEIYGYLVDRDFIGTRRNTGECNREVYKKEHNKKIERRSWIKRLNDNGISVDITCEEFFYQLQETNKYPYISSHSDSSIIQYKLFMTSIFEYSIIIFIISLLNISCSLMFKFYLCILYYFYLYLIPFIL